MLGYPNFSQSLPYRRALHGTSESKGSAEGTAYLRQFDPTFESGTSEVIRELPTPTRNSVFRSPDQRSKLRTPSGLPGFPPDKPRYDVGVVVLDEPVRMATYGALPDAGLVDTFGERATLHHRGLRLSTFDPSGDEATGPE